MSEGSRPGSAVPVAGPVADAGAETGGRGRGRGTAGAAAPPLVPSEGFFEGRVAVIGETRIEGGVRGTLRGSGSLVLGSQGRIEGRVECAEVVCGGEIVGPVIARTRFDLLAGARFEGDLESPIVAVSEEAVWNGIARVGVGEAPDES